MELPWSSYRYESLEKFRLSLRWVDIMPQDACSRILPVTAGTAIEMWKYLTGFLEEGQLKPSLFHRDLQFDANGEPGSVSRWLLQRESDRSEYVFLAWDESTAVLTEWGIFCDFWDDFCYPSSDDVVIYPISAKWLLLYDHEETLQFGRLKT